VDSLVEAIPDYYQKIVNPDLTNEQKTSLYFDCRKQVDDLSSLVLAKAIAGRFNLIYETTGSSTAWLISDLNKIKSAGYNIVFLYPLVNWKILNERLDTRERTSPRKIDRNFLLQGVLKALSNFPGVLDYVDYAYIYDNSGSKVSILFSYDGSITETKPSRKINCFNSSLKKFIDHENVMDIIETIGTFLLCKYCNECR